MAFSLSVKNIPTVNNHSLGTVASEVFRDSGGDETLAMLAMRDCVGAYSPYLTQLIRQWGDVFTRFFHDGPDAGVKDAMQLLASIDKSQSLVDMGRGLRQAKQRLNLVVALADIANIWPLERVTDCLSRFAQASVSLALDHLIEHMAAAEKAQALRTSYCVLALGKLGGGELNYSSDIDLIVLFDRDALVPDDGALCVKITKALIQVLEEHTDYGYVFRVDMRLRPDPLSQPVAVSIQAALGYYETTGQNWERASLIKARPIAGNRALGDNFITCLRPFLWRRNLDFAAIRDIKIIKEQIDAVHGNRIWQAANFNVKLGLGGIREIEFFTQTQQLIYGGRNPCLRGRATCAVLSDLATAGHVDVKTVRNLQESYGFLRRVEHRLQMRNDAQTHVIPSQPEEQGQLAFFLGYSTRAAFLTDLRQHCDQVREAYKTLFPSVQKATSTASGERLSNLTSMMTNPDHGDAAIEPLRTMGFREPKVIVESISRWYQGRIPATRSERARQLLDTFIPSLLSQCANTEDPDRAIIGFDHFLSGLPAGVQLFSLFQARPQLLSLVATIMGTAPRLSERLSRYPILFDGVLSSDFYAKAKDGDSLAADFQAVLGRARNYETCLDKARHWGKDIKFRFSVHILLNIMDGVEAMPVFTDIADTIVRGLWSNLKDHFIQQYGPLQASMGVVALGKYGSGEMRPASDLDLVFIYDRSDDDDVADGLPPSLYFSRLSQRLINALSAHTAAGELYTIDSRLRPLGAGNAICSSLDAFTRYQNESAWTFEHMALTRARVVIASPSLRQDLEQAVRTILTQVRDHDRLRRDIVDMRHRMAASHDAIGRDTWNLKQMPGGLIDIEFISQYLQLAYGHRHQEILSPSTSTALTKARDFGLLTDKQAQILLFALDSWCRLDSILRLCYRDKTPMGQWANGLRSLLVKASNAPDFDALVAKVGSLSSQVRQIFITLLEGNPGQKS